MFLCMRTAYLYYIVHCPTVYMNCVHRPTVYMNCVHRPIVYMNCTMYSSCTVQPPPLHRRSMVHLKARPSGQGLKWTIIRGVWWYPRPRAGHKLARCLGPLSVAMWGMWWVLDVRGVMWDECVGGVGLWECGGRYA